MAWPILPNGLQSTYSDHCLGNAVVAQYVAGSDPEEVSHLVSNNHNILTQIGPCFIISVNYVIITGLQVPMDDLDKRVVDHTSYIPLYIQLKEILQDHIDHKVWQPGDQLPSEPDLCRQYGISRTVVRQAFQEMQRDGVIYRRKGKGTFVAEPKFRESHIQKLTGFYQDMVERGYHVVSKVLNQEVIPADSKIARYLELEPETPVVRTTRLRFVNNEPINLVTAYVPHECCPELVNADLTNQSLYAFLERECGRVIVRGRRIIEAVQAAEDEAQLLEVETNAPLILVNGVSYAQDGSPIEYYHGLHRCDRSRFEVELVRVREWGNTDDLTSMGDLPSSN